jgi:hypothetical protein
MEPHSGPGDGDDDGASLISEISHFSRSSIFAKNKHHLTSYFTSHMSMTSMDTAPKRAPRSRSEEIKISYRRAAERWKLIKNLNKVDKVGDPLTYASTRLGAFLLFYDTVLDYSETNSITFEEQETLSSFWSIQALKLLTGVAGYFVMDVLTSFSNNEAKNTTRLKTIMFSNELYGIEYDWQFAIDNPNVEVYSYTTRPVLYTAYSDYKSAIGPPNHHILHGDSYLSLPLLQGSFVGGLCYDLFVYLTLKESEWVPALSELYRVLSPGGQVNFFMMDLTVINCKNEIYNGFFSMIERVMRREGKDPMPCRSIQRRLREAGFDKVRYSFFTLKKGIPNKMGNMMEFVQSYIECTLFRYMSQRNLVEEELELFRHMRLQYNEDLRNGDLLSEFGDAYYMMVFAQKSARSLGKT